MFIAICLLVVHTSLAGLGRARSVSSSGHVLVHLVSTVGVGGRGAGGGGVELRCVAL